MHETKRILFSVGRLVATPGALEALAGDEAAVLLTRHVTGDWGNVDAEDKRTNDEAVDQGLRILSAYTTRSGKKLWIITEADRSATTLLLPEEY